MIRLDLHPDLDLRSAWNTNRKSYHLCTCRVQVNALNRDGETPVDILLRAILPADDEILDGHCCLYPASHCAGPGVEMTVDGQWTQLPQPLYLLLTAGNHLDNM